jgi:hypothetical protein
MVKETLKTERKNLGAEVPGTHKCQRNKRDLLKQRNKRDLLTLTYLSVRGRGSMHKLQRSDRLGLGGGRARQLSWRALQSPHVVGLFCPYSRSLLTRVWSAQARSHTLACTRWSQVLVGLFYSSIRTLWK